MMTGVMDISRFKLGSYYIGTNHNGSILVFKVINLGNRIMTIKVLKDDDNTDGRIDVGNVISFSNGECGMANCFLKARETAEPEIFAKVL